jgi:hypothetical protein
MAINYTSGRSKQWTCLSTDRPANPFTGQTIFETDTGKIYVWTGSAWANIGDSSGKGVELPSGTTAERPSSPSAGLIRYNETTEEPEWYSSDFDAWFKFRDTPS